MVPKKYNLFVMPYKVVSEAILDYLSRLVNTSLQLYMYA